MADPVPSASSTGSTTPPKAAKPRQGRTVLNPSLAKPYPLRHVLRGIAILTELDRFAFLTPSQIAELLFCDAPNTQGQPRTERAAHAAANRSLLRLWENGFVARRQVVLTSRRTGGPYLTHVNVLTEAGADAVAAAYEEHAGPGERPVLRWKPGIAELRQQQLEHAFAVNDAAVLLHRASRRRGVRFQGWLDDRQLAGLTRDGVLRFLSIPDGFFVLSANGRHAPSFLEIDLGTESVAAVSDRRRDWQDKITGYVAYFRTRYAAEDAFAGLAAPTVLVVTTGPRRLANLLAATRAAGGDARYWYATRDGFDPPPPDPARLAKLTKDERAVVETRHREQRLAAPFGPIWRTASDERPRTLAEPAVR